MTTANKFIHTYQLKQQTPMIHFQYYEEGATLRATEVKPKLDRFIIKKLGGVENIDKNWFIPDTTALNYKIRITAKGNPTVSLTTKKAIEKFLHYDGTDTYIKMIPKVSHAKSFRPFSINQMYFANMVDKKSYNYKHPDYKTKICKKIIKEFKETVFYDNSCEISFSVICFNDEILQLIDKYIEEFFFTTNFGNRQAKGFGSFTVKERTFCTEQKTALFKKTLNENGYICLFLNKSGKCSYKEIMSDVCDLYKIIKKKVDGAVSDGTLENINKDPEATRKYSPITIKIVESNIAFIIMPIRGASEFINSLERQISSRAIRTTLNLDQRR